MINYQKILKALNVYQPKVPVINNDEIIKKFVKDNLWIRKFEIDTLVDVGANEGQAAERFRALLPDAKIISFEPIEKVYNKLVFNFKEDKMFEAYNFALGDETGTAEIFLNEYTPSSSLLKMADEHKKHFAHAQKETKHKITIRTLDSFKSLLEERDSVLLKVDVQGFEKNVIMGGKKCLQNIKLIIAELSLKPLYEGEPIFDEVYQILKGEKFKYIGSFDQLKAPLDNEILQQDAIFINEKYWHIL